MNLSCEEIVLKLLKNQPLKNNPIYYDEEIKSLIDPIHNLQVILNYDWTKIQEINHLDTCDQYKSITYRYKDIKLIGVPN